MATMDERYDKELADEKKQLRKNNKISARLYRNMLADGDAAYEALKTQARIDRALSELAGGPASSSSTLKTRGESALRNEIGDTERQRERFTDNVEHALAGLTRKEDADEVITKKLNTARRNAMELNQRKFDAELNLQKQYHELNKSNSVFEQMYKLYTSRLIGKDTFKEKTGIEVKAMPTPRRVVKKTTTVIKLGDKPAKIDGYELHHEYDSKTKTVTYYAVKKETAVQHREKNISLFENGRLKSGQQLYADLHYDGFANADAAGKQKILEANKRDFIWEFGEGYYNLYNNFYTNMSASGRYFTDAQKARLQGLVANIEDYVNNHSGGWDSFSLAYSTAWNNADVNVSAGKTGKSDWSMLQKQYPELARKFQYGDSAADKDNKRLDVPPESFTKDNLIKAIVGLGIYSRSPIKGMDAAKKIGEVKPYLSRMDEKELMSVWAYIGADGKPAKTPYMDKLIQEGKQIFDKLRGAKNETIIAAAEKIGDEYESQDAIDLKKKLKQQGKEWDSLPASTRASYAQKKLNNYYAKDLTAYYLNFDFDATQNRINKLNENIGALDEEIAKQVFEMSKYNSQDEKYKEAQDLKIAHENQQRDYESEKAKLLLEISTAETTQYTQQILGAPDYAKLADEGRGKGFTLVNDAMHRRPDNEVAFMEYLYSDGWEEEIYINPDGDLRSFAEAQKLKYEKYTYMTDDEKGVYYYLYAKEGKKSADAYLSRIEESLNAREGMAIAKAMEGKPFEQVLYGLKSGVDRFGDGIRQLFSSERLPASAVEFASQAI